MTRSNISQPLPLRPPPAPRPAPVKPVEATSPPRKGAEITDWAMI